jgi:MoaA/NifB/PqqE/SkfB family radical SAM enzyme
MKIFGNRMPSQETIQRAFGNLTQPEKLKKPLIAAFYLTFSCNAQCDFCSQGEYTHGDKADEYKTDMDTERQLAVLRTIRQDVPNIYFLGGEPTMHPGFKKIMEESTALDFDTIAVNTNGILYKSEIVEHANLIVASLHTTDPKKIANIYKTSLKQGERVLDNIERYATERNMDESEMTINCVVTGENISDVYQVAELCKRLGIKLNIAPAIAGSGHPDKNLIGNSDYIALIQWAMSQNGLMSSSQQYLKIIQHFDAFRCTPHIIPAIYPNGDMAVPCPNIQGGPELVNIMETGGVNKGLAIGRDKFERKNGVLDTRIRCAELCHKACYVEGAEISTMQGVIGRLRGNTAKVLRI